MKPQQFIAEFLGTFALIFSILSTGNFLVIGATLAASVFFLGGISGSNLNPAVSLAMVLTGKMDMKKFIAYCVIQFAGAAAAVYTYNATKK
jgi:aquaporin Z